MKKNHTISRDAPLENAALMSHLRATSSECRKTGMARLGGMRRSVRRLEIALSMLRVRGDSHELTPTAVWLSDNARVIEEACVTVKEELKNAPKIPASFGETRIARLVCEWLSHANAQATGETLIQATAAWQRAHPLTETELSLLPLAVKRAILLLLSDLAVSCAATERERTRAEATLSISKETMSDAYWERLSCLLQEQEDLDALSRLDARLAQQGVSVAEVVEREHERQTRACLWTSNAIASLRAISSLDFRSGLESLSSIDRWLRNDPTGIYPRMDFTSRSMYRQRVARIARHYRVAESTVARKAIECAENEACETIPALSRHVGYYLMDDGQPALWESIGKTPFAIRVPRALGQCASILYIALIFLGSTAISIGLWLAGVKSFLVMPALLAAGEGFRQIVGLLIHRLSPPRRMARLAPDQLDECEVLVAVPTLLTSKAQALEMVRHLSVLRLANPEKKLSFMLLSDFSDAESETAPEDDSIVEAALSAVSALNEVWNGGFYYLQRAREWNPKANKFIGYERKRGALYTLNRILLHGNGKAKIAACSCPLAELTNRFDYVITLDADTQLPPGSALTLTGMLQHPLNHPRHLNGKRRGVSILQPRMETAASTIHTRIARVWGGDGGFDPYITAFSDVYQNLCGEGSFAGKGIYHVRSFFEATDGLILDDTVLSHDLLEGGLVGSSLVCDLSLYDSQPASLASWMKRLHRWTRGDWQLIRWLIPVVRGKDGWFKNPLSMLNQYKIYDNLRRSLVPLAALILMIFGVLKREPAAFWAGLLFLHIRALVPPSKKSMIAAATHLALLPFEAMSLTDAIVRTLFRMIISKRNLLEWVPAAEAEKRKAKDSSLQFWANDLSALAILAASTVNPLWFIVTAPLAAIWALAPWVKNFLNAKEKPPVTLSDSQKELLLDVVNRTFLFFEETVSEETHFLPPDNLQVEPAIGITQRTSPTNIGMYLLACVSVCELGLLDADSMAIRIEKTIATLEKMEKWNGHLHNWYDTQTLLPLSNRYVSSVDSGNLAGCLLLTAQAIRSHFNEVDLNFLELSSRIDALASAMDFSLLYDEKKDLFTIGIHAETGERDSSHYDLLASEARLLSYIALMRREVPNRHWRSMGRTMTKTRKGAALLSWSGTMFEYLLPSLFLKSPQGTLLGDTCLYASLEQINIFDDQPWGVSESGYYAFDRSLAYQYKAFGLPRLALKNASIEQVVTPYASFLSLEWTPEASLQNIAKMVEMGWLSEYGFFEAVDYESERLPEGYSYKIVQSHMSHHQGMIIASICNLMTDGALSKHFHSLPQVEAYALLLEEKKPTRSMLRASNRIHKSDPVKQSRSIARSASREFFPFDAHAMYGGGTTMVLDSRGYGYISHNGLMLTRYRPDPLYENGVMVYIRFADGKVASIMTDSEITFDRSHAICRLVENGLEIELTCFVSPLDGSAVHKLRLHALPDHAAQVEVASFMEVCLSPQAADESHPVFQNLAIETRKHTNSSLLLARRTRKKQQKTPLLLHALLMEDACDVQMETSRIAFLGRGDRLRSPKALESRMDSDSAGAMGAVLDPCASLRTRINIEAGETSVCWFLTAAVDDEKKANALVAQYAGHEPVCRALELAIAQDDVTASYLGLEPSAQLVANRMAPWLIARVAGPEGAMRARSVLWQFGISGDYPLMVVRVFNENQLPLVRSVIKAHAYLRAIGVWSDLALVNEQRQDGYHQPLRDHLNALLAGGPSRNLQNQGGGIYTIDASRHDDPSIEALFSHAALLLNGGEGSLASQISGHRKPLPAALAAPIACRLQSEKPYSGTLALENGFGGFRADGGYVQHVQSPMPWCNVLANDSFGTIISDRGAGFTYYENSRLKRITPFVSDPVRDQRGEGILIRDEATGQYASPYDDALVTHGFGFSRFETNLDSVSVKLDVFVDSEHPVKCMLLTLYNSKEQNRELSVTAYARFLLGSNIQESAQVRCETGGSSIFAISPSFEEPVFFAMPGRDAETSTDGASFFGDGGITHPRGMRMKHLEQNGSGSPAGLLRTRLTLYPKAAQTLCILLGAGDYPSIARAYQEGEAQLRLANVKIVWQLRQKALRPLVPDPAFTVLVGGWLPYQALSSRIFAHAGFYQAGGAIGFRDQLQDMIAFLHTDPERVRAHLLDAAAHQFEDGDVQHWWHPKTIGVRTRITDDRLFLPYVTAAYLRVTEDEAVLEEPVCYLQNESIPEGHEDWYGEAKYSDIKETLHQHNLRAIKSIPFGAHGLPLIGGGDWNDGMNEVGSQGLGESVWLGFFLCKVIDDYAPFCAGETKDMLQAKRNALMQAIETHAWDGEWYLRAWFDNGVALGSHQNEECQMDLLVQAWAVLTDAKGAETAFDSAMNRLVDPKAGLIKLLDPPFNGKCEPGYIRTYPPGIRENGGQYTHAACWFISACVKLGLTDLAWELFFMILPTTHSKTFKSASRYRVEPYVAAADISAGAHMGRGGWTWYTGSASLLYVVAMEQLLGFEKRGNKIRLTPSAPASWKGYTVEYRYGSSVYVLRAIRGSDTDDGWVEMVDDGLIHEQTYALSASDPPEGHAGA